MDSFAKKIIVEEFTANFDVRAGSQFMYKDADSVDSRLYAGPGWDYDLTYGNKDDGVRNPAEGGLCVHAGPPTSRTCTTGC